MDLAGVCTVALPNVAYFYNGNILLTYLISPWSRVLLVKLTSSQLVKKFPKIPRILQVPATCPFLRDRSKLLKIYLNIILPSTPGSSKWFFPSDFPTKALCTPFLSPLRATRPAY